MEENLKDPNTIDPTCLVKNNSIDYTFKNLVNSYLNLYTTVNHEIYRRVVKKVKRKFKRQSTAKLREKFDRVESRSIIEEELEEDTTQPRKDHQLWLERERLAQIEFKAKIEKQQRDLIRIRRIRESRERREEQIEREKNKNRRNNLDSKPLEQFPAHNPIVMIDLSTIESDNRKICTPFLKTGVCKYANMCVNSHIVNNSDPLTTLIIPGMYKNMLLGYEVLSVNLESDEALEYEENDILEHFKEFYDDVCGEMKTFGHLKQFLVCSNYEPHLRGNVYIQYEKEIGAQTAYRKLNGRFFAGKPIYCYFTHVKNWHEAICGSFLRKKCTKGKSCNYLHIFQNPYREFKISENRRIFQQSEGPTSSKNYLTNKNANAKKDWSSDEEHPAFPSKKTRWESEDEYESPKQARSLNLSRSKENLKRSPGRADMEKSEEYSSTIKKKHSSKRKSRNYKKKKEKSRHDRHESRRESSRKHHRQSAPEKHRKAYKN